MSERELFLQALDFQDRAERAAFLDEACRDQPALRAAVDELLQAHVQAGTFLDKSPPVLAAASEVTKDSDAHPGQIIAGKYKLLQQIGEGGMGSVWMADQTEPVKRRVALKLIGSERGNSRTILSRFEAERQAIALMDHPHIAKLLDAGSTDGERGGCPFFVMELVKGVPLTESCDEQKLGIPERLNLFIQICSAVQHAHQKGIIHRDLKPTNILVELHDDKPVPKVIDFGLAKALSGQPLSEHTLFTGFGTVAGTPLYMAPEQAKFNAIDIDTRADIYALGVILYELLTGSTPIERGALKQAALDEVLRLIRESEPPTPSRRLSTAQSKPSVASNRHTEPQKLGRFVKGELDWIVMKALAKERDRRYETANGLARDIERFLNHEPVLAGPPSASYRLRKFVQRNRGQVVAAALVVFALLAGIAGTTVGLIWAEQQRRLAVANEVRATEAAEAERHAKEEEAKQRALALRERDVARQSVEDMYMGVAEKWLKHQPRLQKVQEEFLKKALAYYVGRAQQESDEPEARHRRGIAYKRVGDMQAKLGKHAEAEKAYESAIQVLAPLAAQVKDAPEYAADLGRTHDMMGRLFERVGRPVEAERAYREALSSQEALASGPARSPERKNDLALTWRDLGELLNEAGRPKESEEAYRRALKIQQAADFPTLPEYRNDLAMTLSNLGELLPVLGESNGEQERRREAEALFREALAITDRLEAEFPAVPAYREILGVAANNLASLLGGGLGSERDQLWHRALAAQQRLVADFPDVPEYRWELADTQGNLGFLRLISGQYKEAEAELRPALSILESLVAEMPHVPQNQALIASGLHNLAHAIDGQNRPADALHLQERALSYIQKALERYPDNPNFRDTLGAIYLNLGQFRAQLGDHARAARALQEGARTLATGGAYSNTASKLLLCADAAEKDAKLTEEERRSNARKYIQQAIAYYRQALEMAEQEAAKSKDPDRFSKPANVRWSLAVALKKVEPDTRVTPWRDSDSWVIKGQELHQLDDNQGAWHVVLFGDLGWTDYDFEAECEVIAGGSEVNLVFRARSPAHHLKACLGAFGNKLHSVIAWDQTGGGSIGQVNGQTVKGRWYRLRVEVRGKTFKMFLDGKMLTSASSDKYPRGCVGLATVFCAARFRNIRVTDPSGKVLLEGVQGILPMPRTEEELKGRHANETGQ
ncbi:MAG TPA: serine/threonine-protein kinase [Planctomycetaceae bacterium]|jgi:serine/threonine protein kinase/tetratricopeptide (TPR) repeat protein|nr:serine/threonine-protein kinase [Planctomycetaceae bacterium]